jgi:hypothetical protein
MPNTRILVFLFSLVLVPLAWAADTKISALPAVTTPADADEFAVNQAGTTKKETRAQAHTDFYAHGQHGMDGVLTPALITADQNDYNPAGLASALTLRLDADQIRTITGIAGGVEGRILVIRNLGSAKDSTIIFRRENAGSTAANRFSFPEDQVIDPGGKIVIKYDGVGSRWRLLSTPPPSGAAMRQQMFLYTDFLGATGAATMEAHLPWDLVLLASGTQAKVGNSANHQGILRCVSSTTTNSGCYVRSAADALLLQGGEVAEFIFIIDDLTTLTVRMGFLDTASSADAVDGAYIEIPSTGAAVGKTANNSTRTTSATITTLVVATWYRARIEVNDAATAVDFTIFNSSGNQLGTVQNTTNIPTGAGRDTGHGYVATKSGVVVQNEIQMDFMSLEVDKALIR